MPTAYELWATQHGRTDQQAVQVLEFQHPKFGSLWVTDFAVRFHGTTELAVEFVAEPVGFKAELPKAGESTQQEMILKMDSLGGVLVSQITGMTDAQRKTAVTVIWRLYLDLEPEAPALDPLTFLVLNVTAGRLAAELRCAATLFPTVAAGIRYTVERFPTMALL